MNTLFKNLKRHYQLYLFVMPAILVILIFRYFPIYGVQIAFKDFTASEGITGSPWVGLEHFLRFFSSYKSGEVIKNTLLLNLMQLVLGFPAPVILALVLHNIQSKKYRRLIQSVTYIPHLISEVVIVGILLMIFSPRVGPYAMLTRFLGGEPVNILGKSELFRPTFVLSGIWASTGWNSIIYIAALTGVNSENYEAAMIDGAGRLQRMWYIDLPHLVPTIITLLILRAGHMMDVGFEKVFLMQTQLNVTASEVISTYVYKSGLMGAQYSFSAAVGLFNNVINFALILLVNHISKKFSEVSLW